MQNTLTFLKNAMLIACFLLLCTEGRAQVQWQKASQTINANSFKKFGSGNGLGIGVVSSSKILTSPDYGISWADKTGIFTSSSTDINCYANIIEGFSGVTQDEFAGLSKCSLINNIYGGLYKYQTGAWNPDNGSTALPTNLSYCDVSQNQYTTLDITDVDGFFDARGGGGIYYVLSFGKIYYYDTQGGAFKWTYFSVIGNGINQLIYLNGLIYVISGNIVYISNGQSTPTTWTPISTNNISKIFSTNSNQIFALATDGSLLRYTGSGIAWQPIGTVKPNWVEAVGSRIFIGDATGVGISDDNGTTWNYANAVSSNPNLTTIVGLKISGSGNNANLVAVGNNGNIYYRPLSQFKIPKINAATGTNNGANKAAIGETVTIKGANLGGITKITIGSVNATLQSNSDTLATFTVPNGNFTGNDIVVTVNNEMTVTYTGLQIVTPQITGFTPASGYAGDIVTINGLYFNPSDISVRFGSVSAIIDGTPTSTQVRAVVPAGASGSQFINVVIGSKTATSATNFTILSPSVSVTAPTTGDKWLKGNSYDIKYQFGYTGNINIELLSNGATALVIASGINPASGIYNWTVPNTLPSSTSYSIKVSSATNSQVSGTSSIFTIMDIPPTIASFSPTSGYATDLVTINGTNFNAGDIAVRFGSLTAQSQDATTAQVKAIVPDNARGSVPIFVVTNGQTVQSTTNFTVLQPSVRVAAPKTGDKWFKGDENTVSYTFSYRGNANIDLLANGSVVATLAENITPTGTLKWKVPDDIATATNYTIRVSSVENSQVNGSSSSFTIIERPPQILSFFPKEGYPSDSVLILGKNFSLFENRVLFGTLQATILKAPTQDSLWVAVPDLARGDLNINVTSNQQTVSSKDKFKVILPFIRIFNPKQGDKKFKGDTISIVYQHNIKSNVRIELLNGNNPVDVISNSTAPNTPQSGQFLWEIPADGLQSSFGYRVRMSSTVNPSIVGVSGTFSITEPPPVVTSISPLEAGTGDTITVEGRNLSLNPSANLIRLGGALMETVAIPQIVDASKPPLIRLKLRVPDRIIGVLPVSITVNGENLTILTQRITIKPPFIEIITPNGGEKWEKGRLYEISWKDNIQGAVRIELLYAGTSPRPISNSAESNGKFVWVIPNTDEIPSGGFYKIKITSLENPSINGVSKENFFIEDPKVGILTFTPKTAPKGSIVSIQGFNFKRDSKEQPLRVRFGTSNALVEDIEYVSPNLIRAVIPETVVGDSVQITLQTAGETVTTKDFLKIVPPFIKAITPKGGEQWEKGKVYTITYESNITDKIRIELLQGDQVVEIIKDRAESVDATNWLVPLLLKANSYRIRVSSTRTPTLFALSGVFTVQPIDLFPPKIFNTDFPKTFLKDSRTALQLKIQAKDQDEEGKVKTVTCYYRGISQTTFKALEATNLDVEYTANIPETAFDEQGLEYYFVAEDLTGKKVETPLAYTYLEYKNPGLDVNYKNFGTEVLNYELIAFPIVLEKNTLADIFADELGNYNPRRWRMFSQADTVYTELSDVSPVEIGKGYWFIAKNETVINTGAGASTRANAETPFVINLKKGWNLIGNPYNFDISWTKTLQLNKIDEDKNKELYFAYTFDRGTWRTSNLIKKWKGAVIFSSQDRRILIPVSARNASNGRTESETQNAINQPNWEVQLNLQAGYYRNELGGFGMNENANLGIDGFDRQPIPQLLANLATMFNNQLSINNDQNNQQLTTNNQPLTTKNIVPSKENFIWSFTAQSSFGEVLNLSWENTYFGQNDKQLFLYDEKAKRLTDMRKVQSYSFEGVRSFKIFFGDKKFINNELPELKASVFVYPNPFADDLHLSINVPENETSVMFGIYDTAGKLIRLENKGNLHAGVHEIILEGKDNFGTSLKSGAYLLQIHIGQSIEAWKVVKE